MPAKGTNRMCEFGQEQGHDSSTGKTRANFGAAVRADEPRQMTSRVSSAGQRLCDIERRGMVWERFTGSGKSAIYASNAGRIASSRVIDNG